VVIVEKPEEKQTAEHVIFLVRFLAIWQIKWVMVKERGGIFYELRCTRVIRVCNSQNESNHPSLVLKNSSQY
jgi:hypothetical protein